MAKCIDRADYEVAHLYNPLHPAILHLLALTLAAGQKAGIPVSICGEMAADIKLTRLLIGMGFRELSMPPAALLAVKYEILNSTLPVIAPHAKKILRSYDPDTITTLVRQLRTL